MRNPGNRTPGSSLAAHRCVDCRLAQSNCLCALIPRIQTRTRVIVVMHQLENNKTSNTGRLAVRCLPNSEIVMRGDPDWPRKEGEGGSADDTDGPEASEGVTPPTHDWNAHGDPVLLYPHPDARPIDAWKDHPRPVTLIVPDGTWRQGRRVRQRMAGLAQIPCASISRVAPSNYRLRTTYDPRRLATLEAIAEALGALEGEDARVALLAIFDTMVERTLRARAGG
jgi:DTW domain-containing protein YfiP